jgi:Bestrophin, RFP-TM, chloride channel
MYQDSLYRRLKGSLFKGKYVPVAYSENDVADSGSSKTYSAKPPKASTKLYKRPIDVPVLPDVPSSPELNQAIVVKPQSENALANRPESKSFIASAFAWQGSVTPKVLLRVAVAATYAAAVCFASTIAPTFSVPITPFEYSGAVLALILVLRVNAGHDRWWEARKLWGNIVNQSRNLALVICGYCGKKDEHVNDTLKWIAAWPHVMRQSLRNEKSLPIRLSLNSGF